MSYFWRLAEERIKEAQRAGAFDNLPGKGKPLDLEDLSWVPEDLRIGYLVLKKPWPGMLRGIYRDPQRFVAQYWSRYPGIYFTGDRQKETAEMAVRAYDEALRAAGHDPITTEVEPAAPFYYAEDYHQQYLHKVPNGYCGLAGTGVSCRIPTPS